MESCIFVAWSCTHSCFVLPVHPPEVDDRVRQRTLSCDVGMWAVHTLNRRMKKTKSMYTLCINQHAALQSKQIFTINKRKEAKCYLDEVCVDVICVLIGCF